MTPAGASANGFGTPGGLSGSHVIGYPVGVGRSESASGALEAGYGWEYLQLDPGAAVVLGRLVFYRGSRWDAGSAAGGPGNDGAVAADKVALRRGEKAGFANYTSYSRGLNGVMVDIGGLPGQPTSGDFAFAVGNTDAVSTWETAPAPQSVTVRRGAGISGSDRVTLVWGGDAVKGLWLEVRVRATEATGLAADEVFYFGNAIGETGDHANLDARVDAADEALARAHPRNPFFPAPLDDPYDFNRDRQVNATDQILARVNATSAGTELRLITPGVGAALASAAGYPEGAAFDGGAGWVPGPTLLAGAAGSTGVQAVSGPGPGDGGMRLGVRREPGGRIEVRLSGRDGGAWRLEATGGDFEWKPLPAASEVRDASGARVWVVEPAEGSGHRFFRVARIPGDVE